MLVMLDFFSTAFAHSLSPCSPGRGFGIVSFLFERISLESIALEFYVDTGFDRLFAFLGAVCFPSSCRILLRLVFSLLRVLFPRFCRVNRGNQNISLLSRLSRLLYDHTII
jgi:hypothetical protein